MSKDATTNTAAHKKWLDQLTLELRLNDVSGKSIGDTLATVEEFLADSGQAPEEAFGTPREYSAQLAAENGRVPALSLGTSVILGTTSLLGFLAFTTALTPWNEGEQLFIGGWQLACMAVLAALVVALPLYLPYLLRNTWALVAVPLVGGAAGLLSAVLSPKAAGNALLVLPPVPVLFISAAVMVALSVAGTVIALREEPDLVVSPLDAAPAKTLKARLFEVITQWLFPILAAVMLGFTTLITSVA